MRENLSMRVKYSETRRARGGEGKHLETSMDVFLINFL